VKLSDAQRALLDGGAGYSARKAMEILVALGRIYGAERLIPVASVQVSGVSYHNLGDAGLRWLEHMARDGRSRVVATLNPAGMDLESWAAHGVDPGFAEQQRRIVDAYRAMGVAPSCTCTPYLVGNLPAPGEHVAWSESSAVGFANSVLGARTNREGGPSALASALTGFTPEYGLHLDAARRPTLDVVVETREPVWGTERWGALGKILGERTRGEVPRLRGAPAPDVAALKSLCASVVTFGGSPLVLVDGVGPEVAALPPPPRDASLRVTDADVAAAAASLDDGVAAAEIDLVCLGCPHASLAELADFARRLAGRQVRIETWICTARATADTAASLGFVATIERAGAKVVRDTCFVVAPLRGRFRAVATDSAKGCFYARGHNRLRVKLGSVAQCLDAAVRGRWS
jgi:hypothetical protein